MAVNCPNDEKKDNSGTTAALLLLAASSQQQQQQQTQADPLVRYNNTTGGTLNDIGLYASAVGTTGSGLISGTQVTNLTNGSYSSYFSVGVGNTFIVCENQTSGTKACNTVTWTFTSSSKNKKFKITSSASAYSMVAE